MDLPFSPSDLDRRDAGASLPPQTWCDNVCCILHRRLYTASCSGARDLGDEEMIHE